MTYLLHPSCNTADVTFVTRLVCAPMQHHSPLWEWHSHPLPLGSSAGGPVGSQPSQCPFGLPRALETQADVEESSAWELEPSQITRTNKQSASRRSDEASTPHTAVHWWGPVSGYPALLVTSKRSYQPWSTLRENQWHWVWRQGNIGWAEGCFSKPSLKLEHSRCNRTASSHNAFPHASCQTHHSSAYCGVVI